MLDTFHVPEDVDPVSLIEATISLVPVGSTGGSYVGAPRFEKEDVCSSVLGAEVDMAQHARANAGLCSIQNQAWVNVHDGRTLSLRQ